MTKELTVGSVLISEPFLQDPNFSRTVILITEHSDEGTVGFVLNQRTDFTVDMLVPDLDYMKKAVFQGGPVEIESFHFIHRSDLEGGVELKEGLFWGGDFQELVSAMGKGDLKSSDFKFFIGYSGWSVGQLEEELIDKAWVVGDIEIQDIFEEEFDDKSLWQRVMTQLGGEYALLANSPINPQYN